MRTNIEFELYEYTSKGKEASYKVFNMDFEFVAIPELIGDVERVMAETVKSCLESIDITAGRRFGKGSRVKIVADNVLGMQFEYEDTLTEDFDKRQKLKEVNLESLKNDLKYAISLMQSGNTETTVQALNRVRFESQSWIYHMLNKHFDEEIPENFKPDKPTESKLVDNSGKPEDSSQ